MIIYAHFIAKTKKLIMTNFYFKRSITPYYPHRDTVEVLPQLSSAVYPKSLLV